MGDMELKSFEIISNVGSARSYYIEAINLAKKYDFEAAEKSMKDGIEAFNNGHKVHSDLVSNEANGGKTEFSLILMHAEDQLMSAEAFKIIATEFIELYKKMYNNNMN